MKPQVLTASAFAPASVGNVGVGFDVLGLALEGVGDIVDLTANFESRDISIDRIVETRVTVGQEIPFDSKQNTATAALLAMQQDLNLPFGFCVRIRKGIPLGSGMGGSAASAVAAVVAAAKIVRRQKSHAGNSPAQEQLFAYALEGERIAAGAAHPDNVAPSLYGGLTLASLHFSSQLSKPVFRISIPPGMVCVLVHPDVRVETKHARNILRPDIPLRAYVEQSSLLAGFVLGCMTNNFSLISASLRDQIVEPQREHLIPRFKEIKTAATAVPGCLGFSISGSGPSVFALARSRAAGEKIAKAIKKQFNLAGVDSTTYISRLPAPGAKLLAGQRETHGQNK